MSFILIIGLCIIFIVVCGLLSNKYGFGNPLEIVLLSLSLFATLGGAYFGALIAGKYSLKTVEKQFINERKDNLNKVVVTLSFYNISLFKVFNSIFKQINTCNEEIERDIKNEIPLNLIFKKYMYKKNREKSHGFQVVIFLILTLA